MKNFAWLALSGLFMAGACGPTEARCVPGATQACACTDGRAGAQLCNEEGAFEACVCESGVDAGGRDASVPMLDAGSDAAAHVDGGVDASAFDASSPDDAGPPDSGVRPDGHLVLIGHFYASESSNEDTMLCNAVLSSERSGTLDILEYTEHAETTSWPVPARVRPLLTSCAAGRGRDVAFVEMTAYAELASRISTADVLLVYHQLSASRTRLGFIAEAWNPHLNAFLDAGGVVVVLDDTSTTSTTSMGTYLLATGPGLMNVTGSTEMVGAPLVVAAPSDIIADGVGAYMAPPATTGFPLSTGGTVVVHDRDTFVPVVRHLVRSPP